MGLVVHLFGPPQAELNGAPLGVERRKALALLAYLAVTGRPNSRDELATLLWPDYDRTRAYAYLRRSLWELNQALGEGWIDGQRDTLTLRQDGLGLDVAEFRTHLDAAGKSPKTVEQMQHLEAAVALYRGDFMAGFGLPDSAAFDDWMFFEAESLRTALAGALERLASGATPGDAHFADPAAGGIAADKAVEYARRWLALDPLHEPAQRRLMELYARMGQRSAALRQYEVCRQTLERELGADPQPETTALYEQIRSGALEPSRPALAVEPVSAGAASAQAPAESVPLPATQAPEASPQATIAIGRSNERGCDGLPAELTPFVGRTSELEEIGRLLDDPTGRLLTLLGPGGIGKTRLAIQAARQKQAQFAEGVCFVGLASLNSPEHMVVEIAQALHFNFYDEGGEHRKQILEYLRQRQMLLVLDNFEHLLGDDTARLVLDMIEGAPRLKLLVTSRAGLNIQGEQLYPVGGLPTPDLSLPGMKTGDLASYSAVQLFVESARRVRPDFTLTEDNLEAVAQICRLVQGMPLGIELAAAWIDLLEPDEIIAEVWRNLDFLETELRDVPERQRSIRAVFNASWNLLTPSEQQVFGRLAVFQGGFTRPAAEAVANAPLRALTSLSNKSLVQRGIGQWGGQGRYSVHELLRQYAAQQLQADPQAWEELQGRHSQFYLEFLAARGDEMKGRNQRAAMEAVDADLDNVRMAFLWAIEHHKFDLLDRALFGFYLYFESRLWGREQDALLERAIQAIEQYLSEGATPDEAQRRRVRLLLAKMLTLRAASYYDFVSSKSPQFYQRALDIVREENGQKEMGYIYSFLAAGYSWRVDALEGIRLLRQHLEQLQAGGGDPWELAYTRRTLAQELVNIREFEEAEQQVRQAAALSEGLGDAAGLAFNLALLADVLTRNGQYAAAEAAYKRAMRLLDELGELGSQGFILEQLGGTCLSAGNFPYAIQYFHQAQQVFRQIGDRMVMPGMLSWESIALVRLGDYERARQLRLESLALSEATGDLNGRVWSHFELGEIERLEGSFAAAEQHYQEALHLFPTQNSFNNVQAFCHRARGNILLAQGRYTEALEQFQTAFDLAWEAYHLWNVAYLWSCIGRAQTGLEDFAEARQCFRRSLLQARKEGDLSLMFLPLAGASELLLAEGQPEQAVALAAYVVADPAAWREAKDLGRGVQKAAAAHLDSALHAAAEERGKKLRFEDVLAEWTMGAR